jgi:hypothetical protein
MLIMSRSIKMINLRGIIESIVGKHHKADGRQ